MADLSEYVKQMQQAGYSPAAIKQYLLSYGYPSDIIDHALYSSGQKKELHLSPVFLLSVIAVLVLAGGVGYFFLKPTADIPAELLDTKIQQISHSVVPGEAVNGEILLINTGARKKYDVYVKYEIFDKAGKRLTFKSETIALETEKIVPFELDLAEDSAPGEYTFQVTARYQAETARAQSPFSIKKTEVALAPSCTDGIKNQDEEEIDCGGSCNSCKKCPVSCDDRDPLTVEYCDSSTGFECKYISPAVCGNSVCEESESALTCAEDCREDEKTEPKSETQNPWEMLERIKASAQSDSDSAKAQCLSMDDSFKDLCLQNVGIAGQNGNICQIISDETKKDRCFSEVAKATSQSVLCENIAKESRRDGCYVNFVAMDDFSVCPKIINPYLKQSCDTLSQTKQ